VADRWEIAAFPAEQDVGINAMGLGEFSDTFARAMIGQIITQVRTYSIGFQVARLDLAEPPRMPES